jgi:hypothetical protein
MMARSAAPDQTIRQQLIRWQLRTHETEAPELSRSAATLHLARLKLDIDSRSAISERRSLHRRSVDANP